MIFGIIPTHSKFSNNEEIIRMKPGRYPTLRAFVRVALLKARGPVSTSDRTVFHRPQYACAVCGRVATRREASSRRTAEGE